MKQNKTMAGGDVQTKVQFKPNTKQTHTHTQFYRLVKKHKYVNDFFRFLLAALEQNLLNDAVLPPKVNKNMLLKVVYKSLVFFLRIFSKTAKNNRVD